MPVSTLEFEGERGPPRAVIVEAKRLLPRVEITPTINWFIALVCIDAGALGHRADIVVQRGGAHSPRVG